MSDRSRFSDLLERAELPGLSAISAERDVVRQGRLRLLALLFLFDLLLIVATLLSFHQSELVEEEITLQQTKQVYDYVYHQETITETTVVTEVIPYGSEPPR
jgi:hypothetical protein